MEQAIIHTLTYFAHFEYPPTIEEIYTFLLVKASKKKIARSLQYLIREGKVIQNRDRFALEQKIFQVVPERKRRAEDLLQRAIPFLKLLRIIPTVCFIGISGSLSMHNAKVGADVDVCVVAKKNTLWLNRSLILIVTRVFGFLGSNNDLDYCFNLFLEEGDLQLPSHKQNEYTAHELCQLCTVIDKGQTYEKLLTANAWIRNILPNVQIKETGKIDGKRLLRRTDLLMNLDMLISLPQKWWLTRKGFKYHVYGRQVWFIQDDYEKNMKIELKRVAE